MAYEGMIAERITINGDKNEPISAYVARPLGAGPFPGMMLLHHAPGWDEWYREATRKFAHHGYLAICANSTSAKAEAATATLTTSPPRCAPRAAFPTRKSSATPKVRCNGCAPSPGSTARSA